VAIFSVLAIGVVSACAESETEREERALRAAVPQRLKPDGTVKLTEAEAKALDLRIETTTEGVLPNAHVRLGRVLARPGDEALLVAPVSAKVSSVSALPIGSDVGAGESLVQVTPVLNAGESVSLSVQTAELEGQLRVGEHELALEEAAAARARQLSSSAIVSTQAREEAETKAEAARARVEALRRARSVQLAGGATELGLKAPIGGRLVSLDVYLGAVVHPGDVLARVLKKGPRWIDLSVSPDEPAGSGYEVQAGGTWVSARLVAQGGVVDTDGTRRDRLEAEASQAVALLPGATVSVRVALGEIRGVLVPETSLVPGVGGDLVYVESTPGVFAPRSVRVAARFGGRARLAAGLAPGLRIVTQGAMALRGVSLRMELGHSE
jgi:RND family efflux transporter MFP subunit